MAYEPDLRRMYVPATRNNNSAMDNIWRLVMKIYTCTDHDCFWPVGVASVIVATNEEEAKRLLDEKLKKKGLKTYSKSPYTFNELLTDKPEATILHDGNY